MSTKEQVLEKVLIKEKLVQTMKLFYITMM